MEKWFLNNQQLNPTLQEAFPEISPLLLRLLQLRGYTTKEEIEKFLHPSPDHLHSPIRLKDMVKAGNLLQEAIKAGKKIRIIGDYDVDGMMSTTILMKGLRTLGAQVSYHIPHRMTEGYGLQRSHVEQALQEGVSLILTCDNGIAAFHPIEEAKNHGIQVVVTDHHEPVLSNEGEVQLPKADAIINPKRPDDSYPFSGICGATVAFKLVEYLYLLSGREKEEVYEFFPYIALATICDVMPLVDENRDIVACGLPMLENTDDPALGMLIEKTGLANRTPDVYHGGFILGPLLNALGRLDHGGKGVEILLGQDRNTLSGQVDFAIELNRKRQQLTVEGLERVEKKIAGISPLPPILMVVDEELHQSICGIVAGKIKEKYWRPTVILTKTEKGLKGSGRSIPGYDMAEELGKYRHHFLSFGGHAMACGISLTEEAMDQVLSQIIEDFPLKPEEMVKVLRLEDHPPMSSLTLSLVSSLSDLGPFGTENPKPLFGARGWALGLGKIIGKKQNVLKLRLYEGSDFRDGIFFGDIPEFERDFDRKYGSGAFREFLRRGGRGEQVDVVYSPTINEFRGNSSVQLEIKSYRFREG